MTDQAMSMEMAIAELTGGAMRDGTIARWEVLETINEIRIRSVFQRKDGEVASYSQVGLFAVSRKVAEALCVVRNALVLGDDPAFALEVIARATPEQEAQLDATLDYWPERSDG